MGVEPRRGSPARRRQDPRADRLRAAGSLPVWSAAGRASPTWTAAADTAPAPGARTGSPPKDRPSSVRCSAGARSPSGQRSRQSSSGRPGARPRSWCRRRNVWPSPRRSWAPATSWSSWATSSSATVVSAAAVVAAPPSTAADAALDQTWTTPRMSANCGECRSHGSVGDAQPELQPELVRSSAPTAFGSQLESTAARRTPVRASGRSGHVWIGLDEGSYRTDVGSRRRARALRRTRPGRVKAYRRTNGLTDADRSSRSVHRPGAPMSSRRAQPRLRRRQRRPTDVARGDEGGTVEGSGGTAIGTSTWRATSSSRRRRRACSVRSSFT